MTSHEITVPVPGKATRIRGATWTHDQVEKLFQVWTMPDIYEGLLNEKKKVDIFKRMAGLLSSQGVHRKWSEVRAKIKNLKADFRKALEKKSPFRYYEQMKQILNLDGSARKASTSSNIPTASTTSRSDSEEVSRESQHMYQAQERFRTKSEASSSSAGATGFGEGVNENDPEIKAERAQSMSFHGSDIDNDPLSHSSDEGEIISNTRSVIKTSISREVHPFESSERGDSSPAAYINRPETSPYAFQHRDVDEAHQTASSSSWSHSQKDELDSHAAYHFYQQTPPPTNFRTAQDIHEVEHDSVSRSSMGKSHVVSNVIEPVTSIVMPSAASNTYTIRESYSSAGPLGSTEGHESSQLQSHLSTASEADFQQTQMQMPLRLEFVVDNQNIVLHRASSEPGDLHEPDTFENVYLPSTSHLREESASPPPPSIVSVDSRATPTPTKTPVVSPSKTSRGSALGGKPRRLGQPDAILNSSPEILRSQRKSGPTPTKSAPRVPSKAQTFSHLKRKGQPRSPPVKQSKKMKLLEALNKKTVDTISSLFAESSQVLLKELQDSEQRFIMWEEEKRSEERKREEQMFTKLITAMTSTPAQRMSADQANRSDSNKESTDFIASVKHMSKKLNELVSDEVRATEETLRQWETKMQRQESRHTEKIFAMLINAIKRPEITDDNL